MIFDAVRTPRGKGKTDGSLTRSAGRSARRTARQAAEAQRLRSGRSTTSSSASSRRSASRARASPEFAALTGRLRLIASGVRSTVFARRGSRPATSRGAMVAAGYEDLVSAAASRACRGCRWAPMAGLVFDPQTPVGGRLGPAGRIGRSARDPARVLARRGRSLRVRLASKRLPRRSSAAVRQVGASPSRIAERAGRCWRRTSIRTPTRRSRRSPSSSPASKMIGSAVRHGCVDQVASIRRSIASSTSTTPATRRASSTVPPASCSARARRARRSACARARVGRPRLLGSEPMMMLDRPDPGDAQVLAKAGMTIGDIDLFEVNEAFAAVPMAYMQEFDVDPGQGQRQRRRRSRWATRLARPAACWSGPCSTLSRARNATAW